MNERLQRVFDGELPNTQLSPTEAHEFEETQNIIDSVLGAIPAQPLPSLGDSVLQRIASERIPAVTADETTMTSRRSSQRSMGWLWSSQSVSLSFRPAYALLAAGIIAIAVGVWHEKGSATDDTVAQAVAKRGEVFVHFRLDAPHARTVAIAGDFNGWAPTHAMQQSEPGVWTLVVPLTPGVHDYSFIVDGSKWVPDPSAPAIPDGFGGMNSRVAVLAPDSRS